jgi:membrane protease YdiL (CAAX protease family)
MLNEKNNEIKDLISDLINSPVEEEFCATEENIHEYTEEELEAIKAIKEEAIAEYKVQKAAEEAELAARKTETKKAMKKTFSSCGWALLVLMGVWLGIVLIASIASSIADLILDAYAARGWLSFPFSIQELFTKYYLIINEAALLIAVFISSLVLKTKESTKPEKRPVSFKKFMILIPISFAVRTAGTLISNAISTVTGSYSEVPELTELLANTNVWIAFIFVGIVAPIIEELFFRKMLIDRLRPHGEMACLIVSALFFGLFHQNIEQFFYAFGMGLVLAHLYYHSGKYHLAVIIHAIFNITGIVPLFFYDSLLEFIDTAYLIAEGSASIDALIPFASTIIAYFIYALVLLALTIVGIIIIGTNYKKFKIQKSNSPLSPAEQREVFWKTPGIIVAVAVTAVLTLLSL